MKDFNTWSSAFYVGAIGVPYTGFATFSALIVSGLGFDKFLSLLLTMPFGVVTCIAVFGSSYLNRKLDGCRSYMMIIPTIPALAGSMLCWLGPRDQPYVLNAEIGLIPFQIGANAIGVSMASSNVTGHTKKATTSGMTFIGYCVWNIIGPLCFTSTPGPEYKGGFIACVVVMVIVTILAAFGRWHLGKENARRDRKYGAPQTEHALEGLTDREKRDFRYML